MDIAHVSSGATSGVTRRIASLVTLILVVCSGGCSKEAVTPEVDPLAQGYIAGFAFVAGDVDQELTSHIRIEISVAGTTQPVSVIFPNGQGRFVSDALDPGNYDLTAAVDLPGYYPAQMQNIVVVPGQTTELRGQIDVLDTSRPQFENLTPLNESFLVDRRPVVGGNFRSEGSGFKIETFTLLINSQLITRAMGLVVEDIGEDMDPPQPARRYGRFAYLPPANLLPGIYEIEVGMSNWAPNTRSERHWSFTIREGSVRRVPDDFATVAAAVLAAYDGDSVVVAPGIYDVVDVIVDKDLLFVGEAGPEVTTLRGGIGARLFTFLELGGVAFFKGLTLTGGAPFAGEYGGAIQCRWTNLTLVDCVFSENEVSGDGHGGAIAFFSSDVVIRDCVFIENRAYRGGAVAFFDGSNPLVERCVFTRNTNNDLGGAILMAEGIQALVRNCTFFRNDSGGGLGGAIMVDGIAGQPATLRSEANIFVENQARTLGGAIYYKDSNLYTTCDGFYNNQGGAYYGTGRPAEVVRMHEVPSQELGDDPGFCDLENEDLRLRLDSPFLADGCEPGALPLGCGP